MHIYFWVTVTLTSDIILESRIIVFGAYHLLYLSPNFSVWMHFWMAECHIPFLVTVTLLTLTSDLISIKRITL